MEVLDVRFDQMPQEQKQTQNAGSFWTPKKVAYIALWVIAGVGSGGTSVYGLTGGFDSGSKVASAQSEKDKAQDEKILKCENSIKGLHAEFESKIETIRVQVVHNGKGISKILGYLDK